MMRSFNFFQHIPGDVSREHIQELIAAPGIRIERIVSRGHVSPPGFWYDQNENEWVMVLQGAARLKFETETDLVCLEVGDSLVIPAHVRHRVDWTDPDRETIWLAVFYEECTVPCSE